MLLVLFLSGSGFVNLTFFGVVKLTLLDLIFAQSFH